MFMAFYAIVVFASVAMMVREGLWSNMITLISILLSGLVAFSFYSPIVVYLNESLTDGQHSNWLDFAVLWALYGVMIILCRAFTSACSKTRMRFKHPIDPVGGPLVACIAAWSLAAFTLATLHVSPMGKDAFGGGLVKSTDVETASFVSAPDAAWLRFVERMAAASAFGSPATQDFSAKTWVKIYSDRRAAFEKSPSFLVNRS